MGLVDRIKNIFTEEVEEEEEIKVEQIKKEVRSVPIESPSVERVPATREEKKRTSDVSHEDEDLGLEEKSKSPVFFTDRDFEDLLAPKRQREPEKPKPEKKVEEPKKEEGPKPYGGNYSSTTIIQKEKQIFKPTPIISPVYGVLDKNYHKEDIIDKKESPSHPVRGVDGLSVDSIRNKAYGTLEDELENSMNMESLVEPEPNENVDLFDELENKEETTKKAPSKTSKKQEKNIRQLEEITVDLTQELDNLLLKKDQDAKATKNVSAKKTEKEKSDDALTESDLFNLIDSMYDEGEGE